MDRKEWPSGGLLTWLGTLTVGALVVYVIIRIVRRGSTERGRTGGDVEDEEGAEKSVSEST